MAGGGSGCLGVKRSDALQSLSRDHHQALRVAQQLRRADDVDRATKAFLDFWASEGQRHFQVEEEVLLPRWAALGDLDHDAAMRLLREHLCIRAGALKLQQSQSLDRLKELGEQLAAHVRFEERELFPLLESDLSEEQLQALAFAVRSAESQVARSDGGKGP
jgi:hemerythrin-like domain-containing protein